MSAALQPVGVSKPSVAGLVGLLALYAALWMLLTPYPGLSHDAQAYALQALSRLDPSVLGQDIFLRFDSQDRYTLFPWIYAQLIQRFGLEASAAGLTFALHVAWYGTSYMICRRAFGTPLALLAIGLLVAIPGSYGGHRVFHFAEPFMTARLPAEVLSLLAIWCWALDRRIASFALAALAMLVHPLMAFPVLLYLVLLGVQSAFPRPWVMPTAALLGVLGAVAGSVLLAGGSPTMTDAWLEAARMRSGFLFLSQWSAWDWNTTLVTLLTLAFATAALTDPLARRLAQAGLWLALAGLLLAGLASELWHLKILMQGQPWRWLWLARFLAIAVLPAALFAAWRSGASGRASVALLVAAWLVVAPAGARSSVTLFMGSFLAIAGLLIWMTRTRTPDSTRQLLQRGAFAIVAVVVLASLVTASVRALGVGPSRELTLPMQRLLTVVDLITPAVLAVLAAWSLSCALRGRLAVAGLAVAASALLVAGLSFAAPRWVDRTYSGENRQLFSDWRSVIPPDAEVFWWNGLREVWFLLDRRSYLTVSQAGGVVFSPEIAGELARRAENLRSFIDPDFWFNKPSPLKPLSREVLADICKDPALGFVVSKDDVGLAIASETWPRAGESVYLYDCRAFRSGVVQ